MSSMVNIALPKGRLGEKVYGMFADLTGRAFRAIDARGWPEPARGALTALARAAVERSA